GVVKFGALADNYRTRAYDQDPMKIVTPRHKSWIRNKSYKKKGSQYRATSALSRNSHRYATTAPRGARWIFPACRQRVHTLILVIFPSTTTRATWRFGFQTRRVRLFACETLFPWATPLSHT